MTTIAFARMLPTREELKRRYSTYTNNRLLLVIHRRREYTRQAVDIAREELARREITATDVDRFLDEQEELMLMAQRMSSVCLRFGEKAFFFFIWLAPIFLFGPFVISTAFCLNDNEAGLQLRVKQAQSFAIAGFVCFIACGFVAVYFSLPLIAYVALLLLSFVLFYFLEKKVEYDLLLR